MFWYRLITVLFILSLVMGAVGCGPAYSEMDPYPSTPGLKTISPTPTLTPVFTTTPLPTATRQYTATSTPTATWTLTPTVTATSTPLTCWQDGGRIEKGSLGTDLLRLPMDYRVYLPPCYDQQPERRYPVLYLMHGQSYNDDQWERLGVVQIADRLIGTSELQPFMIVMPRDRYGGQPSENAFAHVVVEELIPFVDQNYHTLTERQYRAVGGLSRGAGWSVHLGMVYWPLFSIMGAHSPGIFSEDAQNMRVYLEAIPPDQYPRIYIDVGDRDQPAILDVAVWFEKLLDERDVPHEWHLFSGFHEEAYWREHVEQYLRWYAQDW